MKRFLYSLVALWIVITATFFLMKAIPGDPFTQEKALPKEILESLNEHYKLSEPLYVQYGHYLKSIIQWDLGPSFIYKSRTVNEIIKNSFPISLILGLEALFLSISLGIFLGALAALKHNRWQDHLITTLSIIGISVPSFLLATGLQYVFAIKLNLLPIARFGSFQQTILPTIALAALPTTFIAKLVRSHLLEVLSQDYIKTAQAKGLTLIRIVWVHALRNALFPVVTYLGMITANILTGSFVIEKIFGIPGLGQWLINSITARDYTMIMGITIFYAILLLALIFLVDVTYKWIDPRLRKR